MGDLLPSLLAFEHYSIVQIEVEGALRYSTFIVGGNKTFTALKVLRRCPLVLLVKVAENKVKGWK